MSISTVSVIKGRIAEATNTSKIAVFKVIGEIPALDAVFESTVQTMGRISRNDPNYIGSFHKGMSDSFINSELRAALID